MNLILERTEYNIDCVGHKIKAILYYLDGKGTIDVFIDGEMSYYYIIEKFRELVLDDSELLHIMYKKLVKDKHRWIRDCSVIEDHLKDFKLENKVTVYKAKRDEDEGLESQFKITTTEIDNGCVFNLEYTNNKNKDIMSCYVEASNYEELLKKSLGYSKTLLDVLDIFVENQDELLKNAFSKYFNK